MSTTRKLYFIVLFCIARILNFEFGVHFQVSSCLVLLESEVSAEQSLFLKHSLVHPKSKVSHLALVCLRIDGTNRILILPHYSPVPYHI